jgi:Zn-dependent M28 family amino/carboxypeptidase
VDDTVLMINFDMIGRNQPDRVNAVGSRSSRALHRLHQPLAERVGLHLQHPMSYRLGRSDHTAFFRAGVPILYLFGGLHPGYHTPRDTIDLLVPVKMERVARLAFLTAWEVAERSDRLDFAGER